MTILIASLADPGSTPPSIVVTLSSTDASTTPVTLTRYVNGAAQGIVRTSDGNPTQVAGTVTVVDTEAPFGVQVSYQANANGALSDPVLLDITDPWLVHPTFPGLSVPLTFRPGSLQQEVRAANVGVFAPIGRERPLTVSDGSRKAPTSSVTVRTETPVELTNLLAVLADSSVLLLNMPESMGTRFPASYVQVGDVQVARATDTAIDDDRDLSMPFWVVDAPVSGAGVYMPNPGTGGGQVIPGTGGGGTNAGGGTAGTGTRVWADVMASVNGGTWADVMAKYKTWADVAGQTTNTGTASG